MTLKRVKLRFANDTIGFPKPRRHTHRLHYFANSAMRHDYEDLYPSQFEQLVIALCQQLLGMGTIGFSEGPDGGRDAKFEGTADYPSHKAPWKGITVIQAKHSLNPVAAFSDADFYSASNAKSVLAQELPRIRKLRESGELDHYLLISNRRLSANTEAKLRQVIADNCGLAREDVVLLGIEQLEHYLKRFPEVAHWAEPDPFERPLFITPDDLSAVIEALSEQKHHLRTLLPDTLCDRTSLERKNKLNAVPPAFARQLRKNYLKETAGIDDFLENPENSDILDTYLTAVEELQLKFLEYRRRGEAFDTIYNRFADLLFARDVVLKTHKRLTRAVLFYMYWNCDLGISDHA